MAAARAAAAVTTAPVPGDGALTLEQGVALAFDPLEGLYPTETRHTRESRRLLERAIEIFRAHDITTWEQLRPRKAWLLVRALARQSRDGRGARSAEYTMDMIYTVAAWLRDEDLIPDRAARPGRNWKARLKAEWEALTGKAVEVVRPRHELEEVSRIFAALSGADPRLRLVIELAAELRAGQAIRAQRSDLALDGSGGFGLGRFTVRGAGRKGGEVVDLHPEQRTVVDEALMSGYLSDAEKAYHEGRIPDYYLFPAGRLREGQALVERAVAAPLGPKTIRDMFARLEEMAGVEHRAGRGFYGLRRMATDVAPDFNQDDRVLDRLTGHKDSTTRKLIYQNRESDEIRAEAAKVRRKMRRRFHGAGEGAA